MSTHFVAYCDAHNEYGPQLRLHRGTTIFFPGTNPVPSPSEWDELGRSEWRDFLLEHEWCDMRIINEPLTRIHHEAPWLPPWRRPLPCPDDTDGDGTCARCAKDPMVHQP